MKKLIFLFCLVVQFPAFGQTKSTVLTLEQYLAWVKKYHPVAKQAEWVVERGEATLRRARGGFDPVIEGERTLKTFDDKNYYTYEDFGLRIPTWFGISGIATFERGQGQFVNPDRSTPADGLYRIGLSLPLGQGLLMDKRRADLRKAQIYREATFIEQQLLLNDLLYEAAQHYWAWQLSFQELQVYDQAVLLSGEVLNGIRQSYVLGDRAAVDTLEASIQLGLWEQKVRETDLKFQENGFKLATFLWDENFRPLELAVGTLPDTSVMALKYPVDQLSLENMVDNHPQVVQYDFKLRQIDIDRRLTLEKFRPKVDLKLYALNQTTNPALLPIQGQNTGIQVQFPLFLRAERGELQQIKLDRLTTNFDQEIKRNQIRLKAQQAVMQQNKLNEITAIQFDLVDKTAQLLEAEKNRFSTGESSIFILNSREVALVNTRLKLLEASNRVRQNALEQWWIRGIMLDY